MKYGKIILSYIVLLLIGVSVTSCNDEPGVNKNTSDTVASNDGAIPGFSQSIVYWNGEKADDESLDVVGNDNDIYHEANSFRQTVDILFSGESATVRSSNPGILIYVDGAYVTVDFLTNDISGVNICLSGSTTDGGLKIYGTSKFKLDLNDVSIISQKGPAINSQCKKRMFVILRDGSVNKLVDATQYSDDSYYLPQVDHAAEDRKGCLFAEGNIIFSGAGTLEVKGKYRHGIATDGMMIMRPGTTIAVTEARNNCVHVKGSASESLGLWMKGGLLYGLATSDAAKTIKSDQSIIIDGGMLVLNTTGNAVIDDADDDTSSSACLKSDSFVAINGGNVALRSSGRGGKGINAATRIIINSGSVGVSTSGEKYLDGSYSSSPKGVSAKEGIYVRGGNLTAIASGKSGGAKAIDCDSCVTIEAGIIDVYSYDDAVNAARFSMSGGTLSAYSIDGDGIRGKESITISAGTITASAGAQSSGISCNSSDAFIIAGGEVFAVGGKIKSLPAANALSEVFHDITIDKGSYFNLIGSGDNVIAAFKAPRTYKDAIVLVASDLLIDNPILSTTIINQ